MRRPTYKKGDVFLLFHKLPFDFNSGKLPLDILQNLYLDKTPFDLLESFGPALAGQVLPGYGVPGLGVVCCCLRYDSGTNEYPGFAPKDLLFISTVALRLRKPIPIKIAAQFEVSAEDDTYENPELFELGAPWNPNGDLRYSEKDISEASFIAKDLIQIPEREYKHKRITSAIIYFSQVTCGFSKSFQLSYFGLFAALEALFSPQNNKAKTLASRVSKFLVHFQHNFPEDISNWIEKQYVERGKLIHGSQDIVPWTGIRDSRATAFGRLHEITRLCILGFLSLDQSKHISLSQKAGKTLQNDIDALGPASGGYLEGQRMFLA